MEFNANIVALFRGEDGRKHIFLSPLETATFAASCPTEKDLRNTQMCECGTLNPAPKKRGAFDAPFACLPVTASSIVCFAGGQFLHPGRYLPSCQDPRMKEKKTRSPSFIQRASRLRAQRRVRGSLR